MQKMTRLLLACVLAYLSSADALAGKVVAENQIKGIYAFSADGYTSVPKVGLVPVVAAGSIEIHWQGEDPRDYGVENIGEVQADGTRTISLGGSVCKNEFACELDLSPDGMGTATCVSYNIQQFSSGQSLEPDCPFLVNNQAESFEYFVEDNGRRFRWVGTDAGTTLLGSGTRQ